MALLEHPQNVDDLSGDKGFQWKFHCDICSSGYDTSFIPSKSANSTRRLGFLSGALQAASNLGSSNALYGASQAAGSASSFQGMSAAWHQEHDRAFEQAVHESMVHFKRCPKCRRYVCPDDWNDEAGLCTTDAPQLASELQAAKAQTRVDQMREAVKATPVYNGDAADRMTLCPSCGKPSGTAKFCQNCGAALGFRECTKCHHPNPAGVSFCGECGNKL